jgi:hypothetical protein
MATEIATGTAAAGGPGATRLTAAAGTTATAAASTTAAAGAAAATAAAAGNRRVRPAIEAPATGKTITAFAAFLTRFPGCRPLNRGRFTTFTTCTAATG